MSERIPYDGGDKRTTIIRQATADDVDVVADLGVRTYLDHYGDLWHPAGLEAFLTAHFERDKLAGEIREGQAVRYLLMIVDDHAVGFAKVKPDRPLPAGDGAHGMELEKIYFLRETAGRGHGGALLERIIAVAGTLAQRWVWLDVLKSNRGAIRFYERYGFVRYLEIPFATDKLDIGMWAMRREIALRND
jgi:ribosomal protein S18 acetylase RimI-like enzyme